MIKDSSYSVAAPPAIEQAREEVRADSTAAVWRESCTCGTTGTTVGGTDAEISAGSVAACWCGPSTGRAGAGTAVGDIRSNVGTNSRAAGRCSSRALDDFTSSAYNI